MRLLRLLRRQDGISLVMAVGILGVLSVTGTTLVFFSSSNARNSEYSKDNSEAYGLAEAGINEMMAILWKKENNALNKYLLPETTHAYENGKVTWWGVLDEQQAVWHLTSIGKIKNPTGPQTVDVTRKLTAKVPVTAVVAADLNNKSWNYIMSTQVTGGECDMTIGSDVEVRTNLFVFGNLCLKEQAKVLNGTVTSTKLAVKGKVTQYTNQNTIGTSTAPLAQATVVKSCKWFTNALADPCVGGDTTKIFSTIFDNTNPALVAPVSDFNRWYLNANPGPYYPCHTKTGTPPVFDNPVADFTASDTTKLTYKDNNQSTAFNLVSATSYSCETPIGKIAWDAAKKVLTVSGTMYIDGDLKAESSSPLTVQYNGQATIYLSGSLLIKNVKLCGGVLSGACDFDAWNPNTELLVFAADGDNRQPSVDVGVGIQLLSSQLQGGLYATKAIKIDTYSKVDGPMVGTEVILGQSVDTNDFPNIETVPAGMPGEDNVYAQPNSPELYAG